VAVQCGTLDQALSLRAAESDIRDRSYDRAVDDREVIRRVRARRSGAVPRPIKWNVRIEVNDSARPSEKASSVSLSADWLWWTFQSSLRKATIKAGSVGGPGRSQTEHDLLWMRSAELPLEEYDRLGD
jgi:hypothetical protein